MKYRERVIDKHVAERSTSRGESRRQQHQESSGHMQQQQQQQQQQARSASASGQTQTFARSIPVRYETSNVHATAGSSGSYRQANGYVQDQYPAYSYNEQHGGGTGGYHQQYYDQQTYPSQSVVLISDDSDGDRRRDSCSVRLYRFSE